MSDYDSAEAAAKHQDELDALRVELAALRARVAEAVRMIEGYKRAGYLTNPAASEQATDFIERASASAGAVSK